MASLKSIPDCHVFVQARIPFSLLLSIQSHPRFLEHKEQGGTQREAIFPELILEGLKSEIWAAPLRNAAIDKLNARIDEVEQEARAATEALQLLRDQAVGVAQTADSLAEAPTAAFPIASEVAPDTRVDDRVGLLGEFLCELRGGEVTTMGTKTFVDLALQVVEGPSRGTSFTDKVLSLPAGGYRSMAIQGALRLERCRPLHDQVAEVLGTRVRVVREAAPEVPGGVRTLYYRTTGIRNLIGRIG